VPARLAKKCAIARQQLLASNSNPRCKQLANISEAGRRAFLARTPRAISSIRRTFLPT
jgi:hypothetical protein